MKQEGNLFKGNNDRWQAKYPDGGIDEWSSGESVELLINGVWMRGRFEYCHGEDEGYYFLPGDAVVGFFPMTGTPARRPETERGWIELVEVLDKSLRRRNGFREVTNEKEGE